MNGAHDNRLVAVRAFFQHGEQVVLLTELAHQSVAAEQANFADPPVSAAGVQHPIGKQGLMSAMKRPEAEVHNARAQLAAIVLRKLHAFWQRSGSNSCHSLHT